MPGLKPAQILASVLDRLSLPALLDVLRDLPDDSDRAQTISLIKLGERANILQGFPDADCVKILNLMTGRKQATALFIVGEQMRLRILNLMEVPSRQAAIENLERREKRNRDKWGNIMPDISIMTNGFPEGWPESAQRCIVCPPELSTYSTGQSIVRADCQKHSFHESCEPLESICPDCV